MLCLIGRSERLKLRSKIFDRHLTKYIQHLKRENRKKNYKYDTIYDMIKNIKKIKMLMEYLK